MKHRLFKDSRRTGLFHLPAGRRQQVTAEIGQAHLNLLEADIGHCHSASDALAALGQALQFPDWYGANFDALHDCLSDPDWSPASGLVVLISGHGTLQHSDPDAFAILIDVLRSAAESRTGNGQPLWILLAGPAGGVADLPDA